MSKPPIKLTTFLFISFFVLKALLPTTYACDPLGCIMSGYEEDNLIIGEVLSKRDNLAQVKVLYIFPINSTYYLKLTPNIEVEDFDNAELGKKYLLPLKKERENYKAVWNTYEVTGSTYQDMELVENETGDDAMLQAFINSGGTKKDFYTNENGQVFLRSTDSNIDELIYPKDKADSYEGDVVVEKQSLFSITTVAGASMLVLMVPVILALKNTTKTTT